MSSTSTPPDSPTDASEPFQSSIEDSGPARKKVHVTISADQVDERIRGIMGRIAKQVRIKGFRKGRIPSAVLRQRFGADLDRDITQELVEAAVREVLEKHELSPMGDLDLDLEGLQAHEHEPFEFEFFMDVRPAPVVEGYEGIEVRPQAVSVAEAEIEEQIEDFCRRNSEQTELGKDDGLPANARIKGAVRFLHEGEEIHAIEDEVELDLEHPIPGCDETTWHDGLVGAKIEQTVQLPMTFREGFMVERVIGMQGQVEIRIDQAWRIDPATPEAMAEKLDFADVDTLKEHAKAELRKAKERARDQDVDRQIMDHLVENTDFDVPAKIIEKQTEDDLERFKNMLAQRGMPEEEVATKVASQRAQAEEEALRNLKGLFIIESLAKQAKVFVTESDIATELQSIANRNQTSLAEVRAYYEEQDLLPLLRAEIRDRKVRDFLREKSVMSEEEAVEE